MLIVYNSVTGNIKRFLCKTKLKNVVSVHDVKDRVNEDFVLVTSTIGFGKVPAPVTRFLSKNYHKLVGVFCSGNRNWGSNYCKAGETIANKYHVPLLMKFELAGTKNDVDTFVQEVKTLGTRR